MLVINFVSNRFSFVPAPFSKGSVSLPQTLSSPVQRLSEIRWNLEFSSSKAILFNLPSPEHVAQTKKKRFNTLL